MRHKLTLIAFLLFMSGGTAFGQVQIQGRITAGGSDCTTATRCVVDAIPANAGAVSFSVSGTYSGTLQFEVSADGANFVAVSSFPPSSTTGVTSTTSTGTWTAGTSGMVYFRVRASSLVSGTATITIQTTQAVAASSLVSGGGGGFTAGGDLSGNNVSQTVIGTNGTTIPISAPTVGTNSSGQLVAATPSGTLPGPYIAPQAVSGCGVEWTGLLNFTVGACNYTINGVNYTSAAANLTLSAADPSNPRIDVIYVDTTGVAQILAGTPAGSPVAPTVDVSTQLALTFVTVAATATVPSNISKVTIYLENTEWTSAAGGTNSARVNLASTNNPYTGTVDIEFGNGGTVTTTTFAGLTDPGAATVDLAASNFLTFYIRNKAAWPAKRSITVQWFNSTTPKGTGIVLSDGAYGFNATTNTTTYQQINIPTSVFGINGVPVTSVRFTVSGTGAALTGFYLDQITLQAGVSGPVVPSTLMNFKGTYSAAVTYAPNDVVTNSGTTYVALIQNLNVATTTSSTWKALGVSTGSCTEAWGGSGTSFAMTSGDDAIVNNSCYNDSGVTRTITAVKCRGDNASNTTVLTPTFGSAGTGTAILTGTLTCGNSYAYSSTGTLNNTAWTTGTGIDPGMSTVGNATSISMIVEFTY